MPVGDAAAIEVVGRELDLDPIAGQDADVVPSHLPGDMAEDLVPVVELHPEHRVGQGLRDLALHLDLVFLAQATSLCATVPEGATAWSHSRPWDPCPRPPRRRTPWRSPAAS